MPAYASIFPLEVPLSRQTFGFFRFNFAKARTPGSLDFVMFLIRGIRRPIQLRLNKRYQSIVT